MKERRASISHIAQSIGVSVGTVSNVLNHPHRVRPQLRERVEAAIKEYGYSPNAAARALSKGHTNIIGALFFDIANPFFALAAHDMDAVVSRLGTSILYGNTEQRVDLEQAAIARMINAGIEGLIITSTGLVSKELIALSRHIPIALFAQRAAHAKLAFVSVDDYDGMCKVAHHLCEQGMERFCFIHERSDAPQHQDRWRGFCAGVAACGIDPDSIIQTWIPSPTWDDGYDAVAQVTAQNTAALPQCFVCLNDFVAIGASKALTDLGMVVGRDIAVTGFDDVPYAAVLGTPITTVKQPIAQMSQYVVHQILDVINGRSDSVQTKIFPAELVIRASA
ncbi:LacI family DNA-binding transcriptional regulator [Trueperella sp. LYQ141]|uniref:LacI family DNA-binding transcriptional regulator n=1 Tax=Trueperella sp. LYQ141 TaxID=3391058 RepID=UPI003983726C